MLTILNTSILTTHGTYTYRPATLDEAKAMVTDWFQSAIGHLNRIMYQQGQGDTALVFKLNGRPEEGKILSIDDIESIGYSWGVLERTV